MSAILLSSVPQPVVPQLQETPLHHRKSWQRGCVDDVPAQPITGGRELFGHQNSSRRYQEIRETQNAYTGQSGGSGSRHWLLDERKPV